MSLSHCIHQTLIFFFQAEDGIRDWSVTGVQTCALPISRAIEGEAAEAARLAAARSGRTVAVSNEVGMGVVPATAAGRAYRDVLGRVNAIWAAAAADSFLVVAGRALRLEGPPPARPRGARRAGRAHPPAPPAP